MADETDSDPPSTTESAPAAPQRRRGKPFQKGRSPNPGGRPKIPEDVKEAFRAHLMPKALKVIEKILATPKHPYQHQVAMYVVDRVMGKPTTSLGGVDGAPLVPADSDDPLSQLLARVLARRAAPSTTETPGPTASENAPPGANGAAVERSPS